jgi:two-component system sensor histidine kinase/response regulator
MKYNILIVDDDSEILRTFKRDFEREFNVFISESCQEAIELLKKNLIQVIISDYKMPLNSGIDFLKNTIEICPDSIRILMTGYADLRAAIDAVNKGQIFRFIEKPCSVHSLKEFIYDGLKLYNLKNSERELNLLKSNLFKLVVFEYKDPLTKLLLLADLIKHYSATNEKDQIENISNKLRLEVKNLDNLFENFINVLKLDNSSDNFNLSKIELSKFVEFVIKEFEVFTLGRKIKYILPEKNIYLVSNIDLLKKIIDNLLIYSVKFSGFNSIFEISINQSASTTNLQITVSDFNKGYIDFNEISTSLIFDNNKNDKVFSFELIMIKNATDRLNANIEFVNLGNNIVKFNISFHNREDFSYE